MLFLNQLTYKDYQIFQLRVRMVIMHAVQHTVDRLQTIGVYHQSTVSLSTNDLMFYKSHNELHPKSRAMILSEIESMWWK